MHRAGSGQIVNVASVGAHHVSPTAAVYCATKYAVWAISEGLRQEVGPDIRVTTVSPGAPSAAPLDPRRWHALGLLATRLGIEEATIKGHVSRLLARLGVRSRVQAVMLAYETGLVTAGAGPEAGPVG